MKNPTPPNARQRSYLPNEFKITVWSKIRPYFQELSRREIQSQTDLEKWINDRNELTQVIQDEFDLRYENHFIHHTEDKRMAELYEYAAQEIFPKIISIEEQLNEKLSSSKFNSMISKEVQTITFKKLR